ncbi:hypothetical protein Bsp3421_000612 (plasmid) [Burkholderia sp. FERM BP-3421]|jgi:hypothetical protein|uniref:hypothetical protein n=1 Tax=Burkholderia sp. FERM BP-3421 TaxID=1494466 RepID=UPI00236125E7|nr:hypothetical protein [Burkholderia sp. FERM BP-3421]WDD90741.1 hypothetical protein Bsp3421_000612 [Burkholderia sp. FERM BP-3421]
MKRWLAIVLLAAVTTLSAEPLSFVLQTSKQQFYLVKHSVRRDDDGDTRFTLEAISKLAYHPVGATEPIGIALFDYVIDCPRERFKLSRIRYRTDENKNAGAAPAPSDIWKPITPGGELDVVKKEIC